MDSTLVSYTTVVLPSACFTHYECQRDATVGIHMASLVAALRLSKGSDNETLELNYDSRDSADLHIRMAAPGRVANFRLHTIDITADSMEVPALVFSNHLHMQTGNLADILAHLLRSSDRFSLDWTEQKVEFRCDSDSGQGGISLAEDEENEIELRVGEEFVSDFHLKYLTFVNHAKRASRMVGLAVNEDSPLRVSITVLGHGSIVFFLAPLSRTE